MSDSETPISVTCSLCGQDIYTEENLTTSPEGDCYCDECILDVACRECGQILKLPKNVVGQLEQRPKCERCSSTTQASNSSGGSENSASPEEDDSGSSRRKYLKWAGIAVVFGGINVATKLPEILGMASPDITETDSINLREHDMYAERFESPGDARVEYEFTVEEGEMRSAVFAEQEYQEFKTGVEDEGTYGRGETVGSCISAVTSSGGSLECPLPKETTYSIVFWDPDTTDAYGTVDYKVFS